MSKAKTSRLSCELTQEGINNLIKELELYKTDRLKSATQDLVRRLGELGASFVQQHIRSCGAIDTYELFNKIKVEEKDFGNVLAVYIIADSDHAVFVEFGTGQKGAGAPYPYPLPEGVSWEYNQRGTDGWLYPADDGTWRYTEGQPARPFMYPASKDITKIVPKIAREVFKKYYG